MSQRTVIWVPPSLCGCQLQITGDFEGAEIHDGQVCYRHPRPFSITDLKIVSVCREHESATNIMPDTSRFCDDGIQHRGYLRYPIAHPTPAECLYTFLSFHRGQRHSYACGCASFQHIDHEGLMTHKRHPVHSAQCPEHQGDTVDMLAARADHEARLEG